MTYETRWPRWLLPALALLVTAASSLAPIAAQPAEPGGAERRIEVTRAVVVDENGTVHELRAGEQRDADHTIWFGDGDGEQHVRFVLEELGLGRGYLGVQLLDLTGSLRDHFGVDPRLGVMISEVMPDSPAEKAGLMVGDIVTAIDDEPVPNVGLLVQRVRQREPSDLVRLDVWRDGAFVAVEAEVGEHDRPVISLSPMRSEAPGQLQVRMRRLDDDGRVQVEVNEVVDQIREVFSSDSVKQRLERVESLDWRGVQQRMMAVERQLRELEARLAELEPAESDPDHR